MTEKRQLPCQGAALMEILRFSSLGDNASAESEVAKVFFKVVTHKQIWLHTLHEIPLHGVKQQVCFQFGGFRS